MSYPTVGKLGTTPEIKQNFEMEQSLKNREITKKTRRVRSVSLGKKSWAKKN